jgi:hypothetical protein
MRPLDTLPLHPFLFAVYPVLALLAVNAAEVEAIASLRPALLALMMAGAALLVSRAVLGSTAKGAVLATLLVGLFFSYGHVYALLRQDPFLNTLIGRHRYLLLGGSVLAAAAVIGLRRRTLPAGATRFLNIAGLVACGLVLVQSVWAFAGKYSDGVSEPSYRPTLTGRLSPEGPARDVYYIIMDAYTRADVLRDVFEYDSTPFLHSLEELGFVIGEQSRSNYAMTRLSIPSSLNMEYLDTLGPPLDPEAKDAAWLDKAGRHSIVRTSFENLGYQVVAFESAYGLTDWPDSDLYLTRQALALADARAFNDLTPFEVLLVQTSMGRLVLDGRTWLNRVFRTDIKSPHEQHRERILFVLDRLERIPEIEGPKFVFVHIMAPHPPYAFMQDGSPVSDQDIFTLTDDSADKDGYRNQVAFLNERMLQVVTAILDKSPVEPIIVLQGDHGAVGATREDRMKILNAYFLPEGGGEEIYPDISPVNTFRVIFRRYFGGDLPLLEDRSYFSPVDFPFRIEEAP